MGRTVLPPKEAERIRRDISMATSDIDRAADALEEIQGLLDDEVESDQIEAFEDALQAIADATHRGAPDCAKLSTEQIHKIATRTLEGDYR